MKPLGKLMTQRTKGDKYHKIDVLWKELYYGSFIGVLTDRSFVHTQIRNLKNLGFFASLCIVASKNGQIIHYNM